MSGTPHIDIEMSVRNLDAAEAAEVWRRLTLVAEGYLLDGREVEVITYRFTDDDGDDVEVLAGPPSSEAGS